MTSPRRRMRSQTPSAFAADFRRARTVIGRSFASKSRRPAVSGERLRTNARYFRSRALRRGKVAARASLSDTFENFVMVILFRGYGNGTTPSDGCPTHCGGVHGRVPVGA